MLKAFSRRLTFANVMVVVALFLALGGTVYAGSKISGKTIKKSSVPGNRIKKDTLTGKQINESTLGTVPNANNAGSAQPVAFAHVSSAGNLDTANSKNVGAVQRVGASQYCFSGIPFTLRGGQATIDYNDSATQTAQFGLGVGISICPGGTQAVVLTNPTAAGIFVEFYR